METATLANAFPGRFRMAIGHGVPFWVKQMALYPKSPLTSFRECVTAIKDLLNGETLSRDGEYFKFREVTLHEPAPGTPILGGVVGPKSVDLVGEVADGLVVSVLGGPKYVANASERLRAARSAHRRIGDVELPVFAITCLDSDSQVAKHAMRETAAFYLAAVGPTDLTGAYGVNDQLQDMIARGGAEVIAREMPEEWLEWAGIYGSSDHCIQQIEALEAAGATSVDLLFSPHETAEEQMRLAAEILIPRLRSH
jgi:alkanesulfonate monooxygenase SsuD/methylene tetrahydromethanopterin reductase-like flavin-dependent oxidoreductase (luciferase family)